MGNSKRELDTSVCIDIVFGSDQLPNVQDTPVTEGGSSKVKFRKALTSVGSVTSILHASPSPLDIGVSDITEMKETFTD